MSASVRDRLWLWGHDAGAHNSGWGLPAASRITPTEAAFYLGIPNLVMVRYQGRPPLPFDQYAVPLQALRRVVWSVVGATGQTEATERDHVLDLAIRHPNMTGLMLDDFFAGSPEDNGHTSEAAALSLPDLRELRGRLVVAGRRLELWVVVYEHQLAHSLLPYLELLDTITYWIWDARKLPDLPCRFAALEALAPRARKVLGCYLWDYGRKAPLPLDLIRRHCELGLEWLRAGRIDGMIFLASCLCDLELEAVAWVRQWVAEAGELPVKP